MRFQFEGVPDSVYVTAVFWIMCVFVTWYFYRHAFKKYRVGFVKSVSMISALFFFIIAFLWLKNQSSFNPTRIAVFPFVKETSNSSQVYWESLAFFELTAAFLNNVDQERLLCYPPEWLIPSANRDSLVFEEYATNFARRINLEYAVLGRFKADESHYLVEYQMLGVPEGTQILREKIFVHRENLTDFCEDLSKKALHNIFEERIESRTYPIDFCCTDQLGYYFKSRYHNMLQEDESAMEFAQRAVQVDSSSVTSLNWLAELFLKQAIKNQDKKQDAFPYFKKAKSILVKANSRAPENARTLRLMAKIYLENEKWNEAQNYLFQSHKLNPFDPQLYYDLTQFHPERYSELGFQNEAALLKRAILINPAHFDALLSLANYYMSKNRNDLALQSVNRVLEINPEFVEGLMALGKLYLAENELLKVLEPYEKVMELEPQNSDVFYNIGIVYYYRQDYDNAIKYFQHAIDRDNHLDSHLYLAYIYEKQGKMDKAVEYLRSRIRNRKGDDDRFAEEARKHLFQIMSKRGVIDSLRSKASNSN
ncbi:tetratricopeptide repeat protein [candidate division KSB1 bacterium]|nr:tetratricopeptide repeat protein [candidate division KSB1 bacterium]